MLGLFVGGAALAAPQPPASLPGKPAPHEDRAGETEEVKGAFPPLPVLEKALRFKDPAISTLAGKIFDGTADLRDRRAWYEMSLLYAPFESLPPPNWRAKALADGKAIAKGLLAGYSWTSLGPTNYQVGGSDLAQGRASCLWVHPTNANFIFAGFADGGVWKTTDGGGSWTPISDFEVSTSIGSIDVLMRTDTVGLTDAIVYVGLGEGNTSGEAVDGGGVLKSVDGGATWKLQTIPWAGPDDATNARFRHSIRRLVIDTNVPNAQSVWIAGDHGVYRTVDGGATWSLVTGLPYTNKPGVGGCWPELATDFVIDTTATPSSLYVAFGARSNSSAFSQLSCTGIANDPNFRKNNGIYRSTDGGTSWSSITGPGFPSIPGRVGRIALLQAPSDKKQIYALISCVNNGVSTCSGGQYASLGIFRTADATLPTVTWTAGATTNFCANQGWYDLTGAVDPTNPAKLFVAGLDTWLSTNSGGAITKKSSWTGTGTSFVHADQHHMVYWSATTVFVACDGGIFKGSVSGTTVTWTHLNGGGLSTLQFYGIGQHPTNPARIHGGLQDNGEAYTPDGITWTETAGGDGGFSATDWSNGEIAYEEYVYAAISRSTTGGASAWACIQNFGGCSGCGGCVPDGQTSFIAPVVLDAHDPSILYTGSKFLYRNLDAPTGSTWSVASPDLVGTPYDNILYVHSAENGGVRGTLWVTTLNGKVWVTTDDGSSWTDTTRSPLPNNPVLPNRAATWAATHPADGRRAIVVFSGWNGSLGQPGHVFRTLDGGATWTDVSGALPDEPVFTVAVDPARPNDVYIGTEFGVYVNNAGWTGSTWSRINAGQLPHAHVHQLEFSRANGKLRAATHGRGIWELNVACPTFVPPVVDPPVPDGCGVSLAWTPSGSTGATFNVERAKGGCGGTFAPVATGLTGNSFVDPLVSGGQTYGYRVTTAEASGSCESAPSECRAITVSGACPCFEAPSFAGLVDVSTPFDDTCELELSWSAGSAVCGGVPPVYNVYRSTDPAFVPGPSSRIATCVTATSFSDAGGLENAVPVYYVVRAEDGSGVGGGPCRGGVEEANMLRRSGTPEGELVAAPFEDGAEGVPLMSVGAPLWSQTAVRAHAGSVSYVASGTPANSCSALTTPVIVPGPVESPSVLSFWSWRDFLEPTYDGGVVEISTDGGTSWSKLALAPAYPGTFGSDSSSCANTLSPPERAGFTGNDAAWQGPYTANLSAYAGVPSRLRFDFGTDPAVASNGWYVDDIAITNTSQPTACTTGAATVEEVSPVTSGTPLLLQRSGTNLLLSYGVVTGAGGYNVYEGLIGSWYSHDASAYCGTAGTYAGGRRETTIAPKNGNRYYLVTAYTTAEGPSGFSSSAEIPPSSSTCSP
jgi:immune inhibitor InhA-like protein